MGLNGKGLEGMEKAEPTGSELHFIPSSTELKRSKNNTILSPQPSDDPRDPLVRAHSSLSGCTYTDGIIQNWPQSKKIGILAALSVAGFAALGSPLAGLLALTPQAKLYDKPVNEIAYGVCTTSSTQCSLLLSYNANLHRIRPL